jgi:TM2 domain-containing membrane protein YozV
MNNQKFMKPYTKLGSLIFFILLIHSLSLNLKSESLTTKNTGRFNFISIFEDGMSKSDLQQENYFLLKHVNVTTSSGCNFLNCGAPYGRCTDKNTCECNEGYVNAPYLTKTKFEYCRYKQKIQAVELILEFLFICGIGHFYAMRTMMGILKLIYGMVTYVVIQLLYDESEENVASYNRSNKKGFLHFVGYFILCSFIFIHFYDLIMMAFNKYPDGYGMPLSKFKI